MDVIQKILQETVAPGISDIRERLARMKGEMSDLKSEIRRLDDKIDNGFASQTARMDHMEDNLRTAIEIRERLAALECRASR